MSYTHLLQQHHNVVDDCQRISCNRTTSSGASSLLASARGRCVISKDFVFGCTAEQSDPYQPYAFEPTWCVYIRTRDGEDMSRYVRRVTFRMSPRLPLRLQVADTAPFEITEVLSTDFPIELQVQYVDPKMTPTTYIYRPSGMLDGGREGDEQTDKMIFVNPSPAMRLSLTTPGPRQVPRPPKLLRLDVPPKLETVTDEPKKPKKTPPQDRLNIRGDYTD